MRERETSDVDGVELQLQLQLQIESENPEKCFILRYYQGFPY